MLVPLLRLLAAGAALVAQSSNAATTTTISLPTGAKVTGLIEANGQRNVQVFRGVPYAEPPIGDKRWKPSTLKTPSGNIDATAYGDACVPFGASGAQPKSSENCLFLNVFTPVGVTSTSKRPVMVWIHGGALLNGNSNSYDPRGIVAAANDQVVLVTLNYRLGSFGFLSSKQILAEGNGANFGLRDQEVALQWVQKYIEHFGGDSTNITVFGNSAGSWSIGHHLTSRDGNQKLFQRAILTSGAYSTVHDTPPPAVSQSKADAIARAVGCNANAADVLACMRRAGTSAIAGVSIPNSRGFPWMPTVDGVFMLDTAINRLRAGKVSRVPTITGTTADEGWMFTSWVQQTSQFDSFLRSQFSMLTEDEYRQVAALYPASSFQTLRHRTGEIYGDAIFVCPTEQLSATLANDVTYRYRYSVTSNEGGFQLGLHGSDVGNMFSQGGTSAVTKYYQQFFTNFARTGTPTDARQWPRFTNATKQQLVIQPTLALETMGSQRQGHVERCAFWLQVEQRIANAVKFF